MHCLCLTRRDDGQVPRVALTAAASHALMGSCVSMFSTGSQYQRFHGLTHGTSDAGAVPSHARPYELTSEARFNLSGDLKKAGV
jgi:hypothetical protein